MLLALWTIILLLSPISPTPISTKPSPFDDNGIRSHQLLHHRPDTAPHSPPSVNILPPTTSAVISTTTSLDPRAIYTQRTPTYHLRYRAFTVFNPSMRTAAALGFFWTKILWQAFSLPDSAFTSPHIALVTNGLRFDIFNSGEGNVPRALMVEVAQAMVEYSIRGFCGTFNARVDGWNRGRGVFWISFGLVDE